jgi:hypothetical protein
MATEPTKFPEWASVPAVDPISGQPNIVEPSESKKDSGFNFKERPPRQDFNWLFELIDRWIRWFKQERDTHETEINGMLADFASVAIASVEVSGGAGFTIGSPAAIYYARIGNKLWLSIILNGTITGAATNFLKINLDPIPFINSSTVWDTIGRVFGWGTDSSGTQRFIASEFPGGYVNVLPKDAASYPVGAVNVSFQYFIGFTNP